MKKLIAELIIVIASFININAQIHAQQQQPQQQVYKVPFSSSGNTIDLTVANTSRAPLKDIKVIQSELPEWIKMTPKEITFSELKPDEEKDVEFTFKVEKSAPVEKETKVSFLITSSTGEKWTKQIKLSVAPPSNYELYQNYPNPFNPATTISYQLPLQSKVSLKIYNMLGEEVATIMDNLQEAGYYTMNWNASLCSSGMYVYQLVAKGVDGHEYIQRKKMSLIK